MLSKDRRLPNKDNFLRRFLSDISKAEAGKDMWVKEHFASAHTAVTAPMVKWSVGESHKAFHSRVSDMYARENTF